MAEQAEVKITCVKLHASSLPYARTRTFRQQQPSCHAEKTYPIHSEETVARDTLARGGYPDPLVDRADQGAVSGPVLPAESADTVCGVWGDGGELLDRLSNLAHDSREQLVGKDLGSKELTRP